MFIAQGRASVSHIIDALGHSLAGSGSALTAHFLDVARYIGGDGWDSGEALVGQAAAVQLAGDLLGHNPDLVVTLPPVSTFSQVPGRPLRSRSWPFGRPDADDSSRAALRGEDAVLLVTAVMADAISEASEDGRVSRPLFAALLPEAFGSFRDEPGIMPWFHSRLAAIPAEGGLRTAAFFQCRWAPGAAACRPTRILTNVHGLTEDMLAGPPALHQVRRPAGGLRPAYLGPLPRACGCSPPHLSAKEVPGSQTSWLLKATAEKLGRLCSDALREAESGPVALVEGSPPPLRFR